MPRFSPDELARWCGGEWIHGAPPALSGIAHDTRSLQSDCLYVALRGARFDGHDFLEEARARGACGAVVARSRLPRLGENLPLLAVDDTLGALQSMATGYRAKLGIPIIGVSGSTGKTTVKEMVADMLAAAFPTARSRGNWNNEFGLPLSLLSIGEDARVGVFELGISHPGEMAPLCRMAQPTWGVVTAIGPVHLEFFGGEDAVAREKGEMLRSLPPGGAAVLSADDARFDLLRSMAPGRVITVSRRGDADYRLLGLESGGRCSIRERSSGETVSLRMPLPGEHIVHNALLALAVARGFGVSWEAIAGALDRYTPLPMRWETGLVNGVTTVNDAYNSNPLSLRAAILTFRDMPAKGRKWLVLGDMLELGPTAVEEHEKIGQSLGVETWAGLFAVGELAGVMADGARALGLPEDRIHRCGSARQAGERLAGLLAPGDAVLFKGSRGMHLEDSVLALSDGLSGGRERPTPGER